MSILFYKEIKFSLAKLVENINIWTTLQSSLTTKLGGVGKKLETILELYYVVQN